MLVFLSLKLFVVVFFLIMFLRRPQLVWGIGLLSVTTAVLLDTFLGTFNREEMLAELGFFFYIIAGGLLGGMAIWMWGVLQPIITSTYPTVSTQPTPLPTQFYEPLGETAKSIVENGSVEQQQLHEQMQTQLGREDILDLMFDLQINENDVLSLSQDMNQLIVNIIKLATKREQIDSLTLAIERILTPIPLEHLPRLEKIDVTSPPTVLRQYLIASYNLKQLARLSQDLGVDWEVLPGTSKPTKVRELLLYLYRRNQIGTLIEQLKAIH